MQAMYMFMLAAGLGAAPVTSEPPVIIESGPAYSAGAYYGGMCGPGGCSSGFCGGCFSCDDCCTSWGIFDWFHGLFHHDCDACCNDCLDSFSCCDTGCANGFCGAPPWPNYPPPVTPPWPNYPLPVSHSPRPEPVDIRTVGTLKPQPTMVNNGPEKLARRMPPGSSK